MISRRRFIQTLLASSSLGVPRISSAQSSNHNIIFLTCFGGWDPTRVLLPAFNNPLVNMEWDAVPRTYGDLTIVDHPDRISVRSFFDNFADKCSIIHGILTPSIAHMACLRLIRTGFLSGKPDWPSILASELYSGSPLPHLCISGPAYPAQYADLLSRTGGGGQFEALLDGSMINWSDDFINEIDGNLLSAEKEMMLRRLNQSQQRRDIPLLQQAQSAVDRGSILLQQQSNVDWSSDSSFLGDCMVAVDVLDRGLSQCISIAHPALWDSHSNNDIYQFWLWEETFSALEQLCNQLSQRQGQNASLLDETTIVLFSDMGRAPQNNSDLGKDHWPYSSALVVGSKNSGGRSFGGYNSEFVGESIDLSTGLPSTSGEVITAGHFGSTLLGMMGVDWQKFVPNSLPLYGLYE
jgi:hypothetical protein